MSLIALPVEQIGVSRVGELQKVAILVSRISKFFGRNPDIFKKLSTVKHNGHKKASMLLIFGRFQLQINTMQWRTKIC